MIRFRIVLSTSLFWFFSVSVSATSAELVSGRYGLLTLGVDKNQKMITGFYEDHTGWDRVRRQPRFSCVFALSGRLTEKPPIKIMTWFPGDKSKQAPIAGVLDYVMQNGQLHVSVKLEEDHGGCWNVQDFAGRERAEFKLERKGEWTQVRIIKRRKAYFFTPARRRKSGRRALRQRQKFRRLRAYLLQGDVVQVRNTGKDWMETSYTASNGKVTKGWVRQRNMYPIDPPK